jgi:hypothetical protein
MTFSAKVLTFTANTATGDQDLNGTSFTPKAAIIWFTAGNNAVDTFVNGFSFGFGFTDGTNSRCYCNVSEDAVATSDAARIARNDSIIVLLNQTGTLTTEDARASFVQWNTTGMRINWSNAPTTAFKLHVLFLGGNDLTNAKVGDITISANGTNVPYTGPGFQPQMLFMVAGHTAAFNTAVGDGSSFVLGVAGCTNSTINFRGSAGFVSEGGGRTAMDTWQLINTGAGFNSDMNATTGAIFNTSSIISLDTNGFTLTNSVFGTTTVKSYLALRGGEYFTTSALEPAATGNTTIEVPAEMTHGAKAVIVFGCDTATGGAIQADNVFSFGAASLDESSVKTQAVTVAADLDAAADAITTTRYETDSIYLNVTPNATATSSTVDDEATIDSFTNSGFVINWTNIGNARRYFYIVFGNSTTGAQLYDRPISEPSVSISETLARVQVKLKPISEPSVSISETLARIQLKINAISETTISVSETLARIPTYVKAISEPSISSSETLTRLPLYIRPISESAISVNDTIARWISVSYTLAEPSISVNDSIQGALFYLRQISESAISVNDAIARILIAIKAISDPSISVSETLARIASYLRPISDPSVSISEALVRTPTYTKAISESAITTDDSIVRLLSAVRTLAEPSVSINDTIARIQTILKQISESAISINDSVQGSLLFTALLIESRIKWYYSILTRKVAA